MRWRLCLVLVDLPTHLGMAKEPGKLAVGKATAEK
jgi:hypothetical protein